MWDLDLILKKMCGIKLQPLSTGEPEFEIVEIDLATNKVIFQIYNRKNPATVNLKVFKELFSEFEKNNFICVEDNYSSTASNISRIETVFANIPIFEFFSYNEKMYLFYNKFENREYGSISELPASKQPYAKRVINNSSKINYMEISRLAAINIEKLSKEIETIHMLSPGILSNTNISIVLTNLKEVVSKVNSTKYNPKSEFISQSSLSDLIKDSNIDMSDIIDLPEITGIESGDDSYFSQSELDDGLPDDKKDSNYMVIPNIRRQTPSLSLLYERLLFDEIEIQPEYQRKDRIWSDDKKCKLIESILMQLPLPIFYFGERKDDTWVVIDGLQRITTVQDFMKNKFPLKLEKNSSVYEMNGLTFQEFSRTYTRLLREFEITAYVIDLPENEDSNKFIIELFHRINTYGVKLSDQEIRSAINFGSSVFYLKYLASSNLFLNATTHTINDKRQKDLELCLGALSYIIYGYKEYNYNRYDSFLGSAMKWINKQNFKKTEKDGEAYYQSDSPVITELTNKFERGLRYSIEIFGKDAFKKGNNTSNRDPISKPMFESFVSIFANATESDIIQIKKNKNIFLNTLYSAINKDSREHAIWTGDSYINSERGLNYSLSNSTGKRVTILYRFDSLIEIIRKTTGCTLLIKPMIGN